MSDTADERRERIANGVLAIREGHGANCSSIGSVIDTIFASAVLGGAIFAAVVASLKTHVPGSPQKPHPPGPPPRRQGGGNVDTRDGVSAPANGALRYERWGAWAKLESPAALVALDRDAVRALGLDGGDLWSDAAPPRPSPPIEVHLAVTSRCAAGCTGCYLDARPDGHEPPHETIVAELEALGRAGVFTVAFGGGEPTTREDLDVLTAEARARGITPVLTTSGLGLTPEKIERLKGFAQVNVSYDGVGEAYERVRGFDGARHAEAAIEALARAGIPVGVNVVLTRDTFDALEATLDRARSLGAREAQLLRYKPAGRAASLDYLARRLSPEQGRALGPLLRRLIETRDAESSFRVRIDCALVPFLSADPSIDAATLARFGVLGCEGGSALAALRVNGRIAPCSFAEPTACTADDVASRLHEDPELARWHAWNAAPPEPCASCPLRSTCRGGCKVVARHVDGAHGSDPECPRVRAHREARAES